MRIRRGDVAVVTGAACGIGSATAELLAARGCVTVLLDRNQEALAATAARIASAGGEARPYRVDVSDRAAMGDLAHTIEADLEQIHILVNSAGVSLSGPLDGMDLADLDWVLRVNLLGIVHGCRFFLPLLRRPSEAWIVNVLSELALVGVGEKSGYAASKFAGRGFSESLSVELAKTSVRVACVYPGATKTDLIRSGRASDEAKRKREIDFLDRRGQSPDRVASKIVRAIERGRHRVLIGADVRLADAASRLAPGLTARVASHLARRLGFG